MADTRIRDEIDRHLLFGDGHAGNLRRGELLRPKLRACGERLQIAPGVVMPWPGKLSIGNDVVISWFTYIGGGDITIGDRVTIGPHCSMTGGDHGYRPEHGDFRGPHRMASIVIGDGSWLAAGVVVTAGTTIGKGCLVAAGAVVTHDLPDGMMAAGVPAREIKEVSA